MDCFTMLRINQGILTLSIPIISLNDRSIHSNFAGSSTISLMQLEKSDHSVNTLLLNRIAVVSCFFLSCCSADACFLP